MRLIYKIFTAAVVFTAIAALQIGCPKKPVVESPPDELYNEAISYMTVGKGGSLLNPPDYEKARGIFQKIVYEHPTSRYAPLAELRIADTYYEAGDYITSVDYYEMWWRHHLGRPELPYVIYRTSMSYYHLILSEDRDQSFSKEALANFNYLISNYPDNEYAVAVGEKINILEVRLAKHEMYVGKFYFRHNRWWSAVDRFTTLLQTFPNKGFDEEAMFYMWQSYRNLDRFEEANSVYHRMLKKFPAGVWTSQAKELETTQKRKGAESWLSP